MSNVRIHYFSGTGNTERAARMLASLFEKGGKTVSLQNIALENVPSSGHSDAHIFMFSILSWSAPAIMKRYIRSFPRQKGVRGAVLAVFGGDAAYDGNAGQGVPQIARMLRRRGFDVALTDGIAYPTNWVQFTNPPTVESCKAARERSDTKLSLFAELFLKGEKSFYKVSPAAAILTAVPAFFFGLLGRRLLGKMFTADSSCTKCGLCAKTCPAHTITMKGPKGKPCWGGNCENCNRCMNICPSRSIQTSLPRLALHLAINIASIIAAEKTAVILNPLLPLDGAAAQAAVIAGAFLIYAVLCVIQIHIADRILRLAQFIPPIDRFFSLTFTKNFRRYTAPGFKAQP